MMEMMAQLELPGFRFHPTEEELLEFYLKQAVHGKKKLKQLDIIPTVHLYRHDPWELPGLAPRIVGDDREWYFFVPRDHHRKKQQQQGFGGGGRPSRTTERGFWKATGSDRAVRCAGAPKRLIGLKKTLVYYEGRAPRGTKTDWVMNEYRLPDDDHSLPDWDVVLCKVYRKAVSLKELEQRVAMEELKLARATATPASASSNSSAESPADSIVSSSSEMEEEEELVVEASAVVRPATLSLPQLEVARPSQQHGAEWMLQDPFLTQLRSPWMMEGWSSPAAYYAATLLNF